MNAIKQKEAMLKKEVRKLKRENQQLQRENKTLAESNRWLKHLVDTYKKDILKQKADKEPVVEKPHDEYW
jgi:cell division protein FtsB